MKLRTGQPWMPAAEYGRSLRGLTLNLIVRDVDRALPFQREVLGAEIVYHDPDFAALRFRDVEWMLHADHAYDRHALYPALTGGRERGIGVELRLHGRDPDDAEAAARRLGYRVVAPPSDKGHGLREAYLLDPDGYCWVPDVTLPR